MGGRAAIVSATDVALVVGAVEVFAVPAARERRVRVIFLAVTGSYRSKLETYLGKLMFTRMPPGQCCLGNSCVSVSATPMGLGSKGPLE